MFSLDLKLILMSLVQEEVELEAEIVGDMGKLICVVVKVTRKENGQLVALGKQWMATFSIKTHQSPVTSRLWGTRFNLIFLEVLPIFLRSNSIRIKLALNQHCRLQLCFHLWIILLAFFFCLFVWSDMVRKKCEYFYWSNDNEQIVRGIGALEGPSTIPKQS